MRRSGKYILIVAIYVKKGEITIRNISCYKVLKSKSKH